MNAARNSDRFETARLSAERLRLEHFPELCRMHQDARVMATLGGVRSDAATRDYLETNLIHWDRWGYGLWIVRAGGGAFVGRGALRHVEIDGVDEVEITYSLLPEFWGQGLATEMARALLDIGRARLCLKGLIALTLSSNRASQRVMVKLGLTYERTLDYGGQPHVLFRVPGAE
jgi:[ribosomal protein S5]-alanine N-acetyltransferase